MTGIIFRVSYDKPGQRDYSCDNIVCCFFVTKELIVTSYCSFNKKKFVTQKPFKNTDYFILIGDYVINLEDEELFEFPDADITFIKLKRPYDIEIPNISNDFEQEDIMVLNEAFKPGLNPQAKMVFRINKITILSHSLSKYGKENRGYVKETRIITHEYAAMAQESSNGNLGYPQFKKARTLVLSYGGILNGIAGSPVVAAKTNELIGIVSCGEAVIGTTHDVREYWAISSVEIIKAMKQIGVVKKHWWKFW